MTQDQMERISAGSSEYLVDRLLCVGTKKMDAGIVCFNVDRQCVYANQKAFDLFHLDQDLKTLGRILNDWREESLISQSGTGWGQIFRHGKEQHLYNVQYVPVEDSQGNRLGELYAIYDRTLGIQEYKERYHRATHDAVTNLYNGAFFVRRVREHLDASPGKRRVMIQSNIKDFKLVNQLFGVEKGNEVLSKIARLLDRECKGDDIYGCLHGDEFALCMDMDRYNEEVFRRAVEEISSELMSRTYSMHFQIGVYEITDPSMDVNMMLQRTKMAIKSITRDDTCVFAYFDDKMMYESLIEQEIISGFRDGLKKRQFKIYLQPQVSVQGDLVGAEALARWHHPVRGIMSPGEFMQILEQNDLVSELDQYIWEETAKILSRWRGTPRENLHLSVNVSPRDMYYLDVEQIFTDLVARYQIPSDLLNLEITESVIISDPGECARFVTRMKNKGFRMEIDDFGSGYSSLNMLKDIRVNTLKIDMEFLRDFDHIDRSRTIIRLVIDMAKALQMSVICEGVETKSQLEFLRASGCDVCQGYYFSEPITVEEFEEKYP